MEIKIMIAAIIAGVFMMFDLALALSCLNTRKEHKMLNYLIHAIMFEIVFISLV